ncbi:hypothetical protein ACTQ49_14630 [Luteococcus sp. Sow4_B9]|uniref:hypothetical protein n=1 Tax=Luteococcus sp. Sow4_B9 TaxID=3438792 RepID=UPI003F946E26
MGEARLYAISINEVRDMFGATAPVAGMLRRISAESLRTYRPQEAAQPGADAQRGGRGMLNRLGPLFKRPAHAPLVPHGSPLPSDVETLIAGRFVAPERLDASWELVDGWLSHRAFGQHRLERTGQQLEQLEFELTRAGLPSQYGIGKLMALDAQIPLRPSPGMTVGYCKHAHVLATAKALDAVLPEVLPESHARAADLAVFLGRFQEWGGAARTSGRPQPDLFVILDGRV